MDQPFHPHETPIEELDRLRKQVARLEREKEQTLQSREKRLGELLALSAISQATAGETNLEQLYRVIHTEITRVMGTVNFMIAHYDAERDYIQIPYAFEEGQVLQIDPFPIGQGLTSILIRTCQPLLLVEDTEKRAHALGAKVFGSPAKSWLGVPLIVAGGVIGAIIVQDLEHEHRFNEDDQRLLTTLAGQVAIAIRNVSLIENANRQAEQDRILKEISSALMRSGDIDTILRTTIYELGRALRASEAMIQLELPFGEDYEGRLSPFKIPEKHGQST